MQTQDEPVPAINKVKESDRLKMEYQGQFKLQINLTVEYNYDNYCGTIDYRVDQITPRGVVTVE